MGERKQQLFTRGLSSAWGESVSSTLCAENPVILLDGNGVETERDDVFLPPPPCWVGVLAHLVEVRNTRSNKWRW